MVGEAFIEVIADNTGKGEEFGLESQHPIGPSALATNASPDLKSILEKLCNLHMLSRIEIDLPWFIQAKLLSPNEAELSLEVNRQLCAEIAPLSMDLIDAFDLPEDMLAAPIASDWVKYNEYDNQGELASKQEFLKHIK